MEQTIDNIKPLEAISKPVEPAKPTEFPAIEMAFKKIEELELLNKRLSEQIQKADTLLAESILKGKGFAGHTQQLSEEEQIKEEARKYLANSGLDPFKMR